MKDSRSGIRYRLVDSDDLPWVSRLDWQWLFLLSLLTAFSGAILLGVVLASGVRGKGRSALPLYIYRVLALLYAAWGVHDVALGRARRNCFVWVRFVVSRSIYAAPRDDPLLLKAEGIVFRISPLLTALFSVWYICGLLRADYPLDETGKGALGSSEALSLIALERSRYSERSAVSGSTPAARRAGTRLAAIATIATPSAAKP
jgi:hypothetical protein